MAMKNHPAIYVPVPLFYIAFYFFSVLIQNEIPIGMIILKEPAAKAVGWIFLAAGLVHVLAAWIQFLRTGNTLVTIRPANSLQTGGVYAFSRNPMYIGFYFLYLSAAILYGNWWTFIVMPFLGLIMDLYVVKREEKYLRRRFGKEYKAYKKKVRRWL